MCKNKYCNVEIGTLKSLFRVTIATRMNKKKKLVTNERAVFCYSISCLLYKLWCGYVKCSVYIVLSRDWVTIDGVWIGNWIYWALTDQWLQVIITILLIHTLKCSQLQLQGQLGNLLTDLCLGSLRIYFTDLPQIFWVSALKHTAPWTVVKIHS
jgi:hypothetical protein